METLSNIQNMITQLNEEIKAKDSIISNLKHNNITQQNDIFTPNYKKDYFEIINSLFDMRSGPEQKNKNLTEIYRTDIDNIIRTEFYTTYQQNMSCDSFFSCTAINNLSFLQDDLQNEDEYIIGINMSINKSNDNNSGYCNGIFVTNYLNIYKFNNDTYQPSKKDKTIIKKINTKISDYYIDYIQNFTGYCIIKRNTNNGHMTRNYTAIKIFENINFFGNYKHYENIQSKIDRKSYEYKKYRTDIIKCCVPREFQLHLSENDYNDTLYYGHDKGLGEKELQLFQVIEFIENMVKNKFQPLRTLNIYKENKANKETIFKLETKIQKCSADKKQLNIKISKLEKLIEETEIHYSNKLKDKIKESVKLIKDVKSKEQIISTIDSDYEEKINILENTIISQEKLNNQLENKILKLEDNIVSQENINNILGQKIQNLEEDMEVKKSKINNLKEVIIKNTTLEIIDSKIDSITSYFEKKNNSWLF